MPAKLVLPIYQFHVLTRTIWRGFENFNLPPNSGNGHTLASRAGPIFKSLEESVIEGPEKCNPFECPPCSLRLNF